MKTKIIKSIIGILIVIFMFLCFCSSCQPKLREKVPISNDVEMELVDATIDAKQTEGLTTTTLSVSYGTIINMVTFTGFEGFCMRWRTVGDRIPMYLNTMKDENGIPRARWLNMGK